MTRARTGDRSLLLTGLIALGCAASPGDTEGGTDTVGGSTSGESSGSTTTSTSSTGGTTTGGSSSESSSSGTTGSTSGADDDGDTGSGSGSGADESTTGTGSDTTGGGEPSGSPGCGTPDPASGDLVMDVSGNDGQYVVSLPAGYDPETPYPLGFAFHGRGRTGPNCQDGDCAGFQDAMEDHAILAYMTSLGGDGWEGDGERELNVEFFDAVLTSLREGYCVDENTIFVAGTSSGAHFTNVLACRFGDTLAAVAPVAGYLPERDDCQGPVPALVIHGVSDPHVPPSDGEEARDFYRERNGCDETTEPPIADVHQRVLDDPEGHECAIYQGCDPGLPVHWCEHNEGGYDDSTHGWPLFGGQQIWDFVQAL